MVSPLKASMEILSDMIFLGWRSCSEVGLGLQLVKAARESAEKDNQRMAGRKLVIEKKKEEQERLLLQAEREEEEKRAVQERLTAAAEEERRRIDRSGQHTTLM